MMYHGRIQNGQIVLTEPVALPEGAEVRVDVLDAEGADTNSGESGKTLYKRLKPFIGTLDDLPPDLSVNLDHYLYGGPKREDS